MNVVVLKSHAKMISDLCSVNVVSQELIFQVKGFKPFGWYLTLVQFALYTLFGVAESVLRCDSHRR